jgi:hypothetical protein
MNIEEELATCKANLSGHQDRSMRYIVDLDNQRERIQELKNVVSIAYHALRSYQYGNSSTDLAQEIADQCYKALEDK